MCGRFSFSPLAKILEDRFDVKVDPTLYKPRYNCAPSQNLAVITNAKPEQISFFRWGLIPFWAKDEKIGNKLINAKSETIMEKPSFKNSFKKKRCLVLSDGFFEWKKINTKEKVPYRMFLENEPLFAMAGIWDSWKDTDGNSIYSFSILTTEANELMQNIHHRMPVILSRPDEKLWLNENDPEELLSLFAPFPSEKMTAHPVSKLVNSPINDKPEILEPVEYNLD